VRCLCANHDIIRASTNGSAESAELKSATARILQSTGLAVDVLPLRSVGVQGDGRTYAHPALLTRGEGAFLPGEEGAATWDELESVSTELTNSSPAINRVLFQLGPQKRLEQRLCEGFLTRERLDLLRDADAIVMDALERHDLMAQVTQMPTVLVPLSCDGKAESIVLRPITTDDFMTARFHRLPTVFLREVTEEILGLEGVEAVYYDVTHKPPGTVEWE
jgi:GMP synthase (glutamine-hydrolysing)